MSLQHEIASYLLCLSEFKQDGRLPSKYFPPSNFVKDAF